MTRRTRRKRRTRRRRARTMTKRATRRRRRCLLTSSLPSGIRWLLRPSTCAVRLVLRAMIVFPSSVFPSPPPVSRSSLVAFPLCFPLRCPSFPLSTPTHAQPVPSLVVSLPLELSFRVCSKVCRRTMVNTWCLMCVLHIDSV